MTHEATSRPSSTRPEGRRRPRVPPARLLGETFTACSEGILVTDCDGRILEAGGAIEKVFGYPPGDVAGLAIEQLLLPPSTRRDPEPAQRGLSAVEPFPYPGRDMELSARRASGREFPAEVTVIELDGDGENGASFLAFVRDRSQIVELEELRAEHKALALKVPLDIESERRRIARGLHDQVGNALAMAKMGLGELRRQHSDDATLEAIEEIERQTAKAMQEIRSLTFELSSPVLYELGLEAALKSLGRRLAERHEIAFEFSNDDQSKPLPEARQVILYRIVEELMVNVVKHAWASQVRIAVERAAEQIRITVEDDGVGVESVEGKLPGPDGGFGLFGVRQRLAHIDGKLEIGSAFPSGTRATISAPLDPDED